MHKLILTYAKNVQLVVCGQLSVHWDQAGKKTLLEKTFYGGEFTNAKAVRIWSKSRAAIHDNKSDFMFQLESLTEQPESGSWLDTQLLQILSAPSFITFPI